MKSFRSQLWDIISLAFLFLYTSDRHTYMKPTSSCLQKFSCSRMQWSNRMVILCWILWDAIGTSQQKCSLRLHRSYRFWYFCVECNKSSPNLGTESYRIVALWFDSSTNELIKRWKIILKKIRNIIIELGTTILPYESLHGIRL